MHRDFLITLYHGEKDLGRLSGVCVVYIVANGVVFDVRSLFLLFNCTLIVTPTLRIVKFNHHNIISITCGVSDI